MANIFSKEFADAARKDPPFIPFVAHKVHEKPWMVPLGSHERAAKFWKETISKKSKNHSQQVNLQAWILYTLRFIFSGDLTNSWCSFGGLQAQFSHLSIVLHLAVTETASFAIAYDQEIRLKIQRMARKRDSAVDFGKLSGGENEEIKRYLKESLGKGRANVNQAPYHLRKQQSNVTENSQPLNKGYKGISLPVLRGKGKVLQAGHQRFPRFLPRADSGQRARIQSKCGQEIFS